MSSSPAPTRCMRCNGSHTCVRPATNPNTGPCRQSLTLLSRFFQPHHGHGSIHPGDGRKKSNLPAPLTLLLLGLVGFFWLRAPEPHTHTEARSHVNGRALRLQPLVVPIRGAERGRRGRRPPPQPARARTLLVPCGFGAASVPRRSAGRGAGCFDAHSLSPSLVPPYTHDFLFVLLKRPGL
jgi:hypothetical protein